MIGTPPRSQIAAQCFGVLSGRVIGSIVYLRLIPEPATMLVTDERPAPAVATRKLVNKSLATESTEKHRIFNKCVRVFRGFRGHLQGLAF
jgi:hypothetical protein